MLCIVGDLLPWKHSLHLLLGSSDGFGIHLRSRTIPLLLLLCGITTILIATLLTAASRTVGSSSRTRVGVGVASIIRAVVLVVVPFANEAFDKLTLFVFNRACRAAGLASIATGGGGRPVLGQLVDILL